MKINTIYKDLGVIDYKEAWDYQENLFAEVTNIKIQNRDLPQCEQIEYLNYLLFCQHPHVYTLGKSGSQNNLLINSIQLQAKHASFYKINRGGDITYHGPGQLVAYPILDMELFGLGVKAYVHALEEVVIRAIAEYGIKGDRLDGATGVWLDTESKNARKICAIGIKTSRFVSMHGFAMNINTDLNYFNYINPCGFVDKGVTSMQKELGKELDFNEVQEVFRQKFIEVFEMNLI